MYLVGKQSRRAFLRHSATFSGVTLAPLGLSLSGIGAASAQSTGDYKALVCIYLQGGNDQHNTVVPYDDRSYASYAANRGAVGVARASLEATSLTAPSVLDGRQFALHPNMTGLKGLYDQKKLAVIGNAGPLIYPVSNRTQLWSGAVPTPAGIAGHPEQTALMLAAGPDTADGTGWGGRMGDLLQILNSGTTSICMSTSGLNSMQSGIAVSPITIGAQGIPAFNSLTGIFNTGTAGTAAFRALQMQQPDNLLEKELLTTVRRSIEGTSIVNGALASQPALSTSFENNSIASQLQVIARLISIRSRLSQRRQVFFVEFGSFDHHGGLSDDHPTKLGQLSRAMASFYQATVELGVADQVTSFTTSDFGRSLTPNGGGGGAGSDHGWGGHYLVMGGAVKGGDIYGNIPEPILDTALDWGAGRTVPGVSMEEYHAPLARWMGVSVSDMQTVLPNLGRFARSNLGFMG